MGKVLIAAHIPQDSALHREILNEQEQTGQTVSSIVREALADRYRHRYTKGERDERDGLENGRDGRRDDCSATHTS